MPKFTSLLCTVIAVLGTGVLPLAEPAPSRASVALALRHEFQQDSADVFISCRFDENPGGEAPAYFVKYWFDGPNAFDRGGSWFVGAHGAPMNMKVTASGQTVGASTGGPFRWRIEPGHLWSVRGFVSGGSTLSMAWVSWEAEVQCHVAVDGIAVEPFLLRAGHYGMVRAADLARGIGADSPVLGATVLGAARIRSVGTLLGAGLSEVAEKLEAVSPSGERVSEENGWLALHHMERGDWTLIVPHRVRRGPMPILFWATF